MRPIFLLPALLAAVTAYATEAVVYAIGSGGNLPPLAVVSVRLDLHGIETVNVWANGASLGGLFHPYNVNFTTLAEGSTNTVVVVAGDFLRRVTTNTFEFTSRARTYNKRR